MRKVSILTNEIYTIKYFYYVQSTQIDTYNIPIDVIQIIWLVKNKHEFYKPKVERKKKGSK